MNEWERRSRDLNIAVAFIFGVPVLVLFGLAAWQTWVAG